MDWSRIREGREKAAQMLPPILRLPIVRSPRDVLLRLVRDGESLLDVGANDRNVKGFLADAGLDVQYFSFDIDRSLPHDYYELSAVDRKFDVVVIFEVIEHIPLEEARELIFRTQDLVLPGGRVILSTPNVCHPVRFWRDCTHVTPFRYDELAGLLLSAGFSKCEVFRVYNMRWRRRLWSIVFRPLLSLLDIDFATGVVVTGMK